MMKSNEEVCEYIRSELDRMDKYILIKPNIIRAAMYRYKLFWVCSITKDIYNETKKHLRTKFVNELITNVIHQKYPTANIVNE